MSSLSEKSIEQINTVDKLTHLSYQTAKSVISKMKLDQCTKLFTELKAHLNHMYRQVSGSCRPKDFNALMGGIKKLEVLYGYFWDRLNETQYAEVR